ncbi:MAG: hypothetical protein COX30_00710 [Candidatus Moranbacteria bacterium CG23_combo_of_CG06-09_8_20_14_all_39_10]|nr:MAG: hypothetical protein COX30_00710 [Candidatus Moranbacteria bacterium CG23_combo_of_CG06-09_8_20_14_all_39_10]
MQKFAKFHFKGQKNDESIILVIRRHWFDIFKQMLLIFFMIAALFGSLILLPLLFPIFTEATMHSLFVFLENSFAMFIWIVLFLIWIDYYFDIWIVTNKRIVNINQKGLFIRTVSELEFYKIQDVTTEVKGVISTFLNFGNVFIQTAGEKERFVFQQVPDPYAIKDLIMNLEEKEEKAGNCERARDEARELESVFRGKIDLSK